MILYLLLALGVAYVVRYVVTKRSRDAFCAGGCVTVAIRQPGKRAGLGWRHGYARLAGDTIEWRGEYKLGGGADRTFDVADLRVDEHRPVVKGETMLSELCDLVFARYRDEPLELGVPRAELDTFLGWVRTR